MKNSAHPILLVLFFLITVFSVRGQDIDLLLINGIVYDGLGNPPKQEDVGIKDDRIVFIGDGKEVSAKESIDISGLWLCPGFIDPHTHAREDLLSEERKHNLNYLTQGVTTVFIGNDGRGLHIEKTFQTFQRQGIGTHVAMFVGHGSLRNEILGMEDRPPLQDEMDKMKALLEQGMREGALGLSTGLFYSPGSFAGTEEVIELAKVAAQYGGVYDTHQRDESSYSIGLLASVDEVIEIGEKSGIPLHFSHIKALGADVWGMSKEVVKKIEAAQKRGVHITANQYPYTASRTSLVAATIPRWVEDGGREKMIERLNNPGLGKRIGEEIADNIRRRGGPGSLVLSGTNSQALEGRSLAEIADMWGMNVVQTAIRIVQEENNPKVISHNMKEEDLVYFMKQAWVMTGSDGSVNHPRKYGTYPEKFATYVQEKKVITPTQFIYNSTGAVADFFGLEKRGKILENHFADILVFDPQSFEAQADFTHPNRLSEGVKFLLLNGEMVIREGRYLGNLAGKPLRKKVN